MVASTLCSSSGLTGTKESAAVVMGETAALAEVDVVIGRAKEDVIDFYAVVSREDGAIEGATHSAASRKRGLPYRQAAQLL